jgi:hypothetical protein
MIEGRREYKFVMCIKGMSSSLYLFVHGREEEGKGVHEWMTILLFEFVILIQFPFFHPHFHPHSHPHSHSHPIFRSTQINTMIAVEM